MIHPYFFRHAIDTDPSVDASEAFVQLNELAAASVENIAEPEGNVIEKSQEQDVEEPCEEPPRQKSSENSCIFCDKQRKFYKSNWQPLHLCASKTATDNLIAVASQLDDRAILDKVNSASSQNLMIHYHNICKRNYQYSLDKTSTNKQITEKKTWHKKRDVHRIAFEQVSMFVKDNIIEKKNSYFLSYLETTYRDSLNIATAEESIEMDVLTSDQTIRSHLEHKLLKTA